MTSLLNRLFGRVKKGSGATAKNRLHFVLQHDRINLPPERSEAMKKEILAVIVKYLAVDQDRVEIALEQRDRSHSKLVAEIPIVGEVPAPIRPKPEPAAPASSRAESNGVDKADRADEEDSPAPDDEIAEEGESEVEDETEDTAPEEDEKR